LDLVAGAQSAAEAFCLRLRVAHLHTQKNTTALRRVLLLLLLVRLAAEAVFNLDPVDIAQGKQLQCFSQ
jgi:hypothetical protein